MHATCAHFCQTIAVQDIHIASRGSVNERSAFGDTDNAVMLPMKKPRRGRSMCPPASAGIPPLITVEIRDEAEELMRTYREISMDTCTGALAEEISRIWQVGVKEVALLLGELKAWPPSDADDKLRADYIHALDANELRCHQSMRIQARKELKATDAYGHCDGCHQNDKDLFRRAWRDNDGAMFPVGICRACEGRTVENYQSSKNSGLLVGAVWLHSTSDEKKKM